MAVLQLVYDPEIGAEDGSMQASPGDDVDDDSGMNLEDPAQSDSDQEDQEDQEEEGDEEEVAAGVRFGVKYC